MTERVEYKYLKPKPGGELSAAVRERRGPTYFHKSERKSERKRVPCSNAMTRHVRTVYATVPYGFKKESRSSLFSSTNQPLSLV
jgi:hypothetical protein